MHFEGFSGIGIGLLFVALAGCVLAIAVFLLVPIALFGKPRRHPGFPYLGIAAVIEPFYFLGMGVFSWVFPESTAFDRLGFLIWLPMPFLGLTFAAIGFFFSVRSDQKLVTAGAVAMLAIFALQGLMFLLWFWH